jgi:hypothetical protein
MENHSKEKPKETPRKPKVHNAEKPNRKTEKNSLQPCYCNDLKSSNVLGLDCNSKFELHAFESL